MDALIPLLSGALVSATNFALIVGLAAVGACVSERAGVLNLGHEGVLISGAAAGFVTAYLVQDPWLGLAAGIGAGLCLGLIKALWSVIFKTEQVINGLLLVPIGFGFSDLIYKHQFIGYFGVPRLEAIPPVAIPVLQHIPVIGTVLFNRSPVVYLALGVIAFVSWWLARSRRGMIVRAAGDSPETLDFNGIGVDSHRFAAVLVGTALAGFAGAMLAIDQLQLFQSGMTAGRGWIAIAIVIVGGWRPWPCMLAAFMFGLVDMLQFQVQIEALAIPYELLLSLPYLLTIAALALWRVKVRPPATLGHPYHR
jgi:simple sugar transport system permease protein